MMDSVLKAAFGTDQACRCERHMTDKIAEHTERKIDEMNAATRRLNELQPAANLTEAMRQVLGD
jgi:hypothetical protein